MEKIISCCGVVCSDCEHYPSDCKGCPAIKGKVFWLEYTGGSICEIYDCCINHKKLEHCGKCAKLPCEHYNGNDPTKSEAENAEDHAKQMKQLKSM